MRQGSGFRVVAAIVLLGVVALISAGAYAAGFAAASPSGTTTMAPWAYGGAFGAGHVIGFIVTIIILIVMFRLIGLIFFGHRRRAWGHYGYWHGEGDAGRFGPGVGPGEWHRGEWGPAGQAAFDEFHRRAHATQPPSAGPSPTGPGASGADEPR